MPKKPTLSQQLADAKQEIAILKRENARLSGTAKPADFDIHSGLDQCVDYLTKNSFYARGVNSDGIASLVRSAREKLRIATKK